MVEILVKYCSLYNKYLLPLVLISVEFPEIGADAWDVLFFGVAKEKSSKKHSMKSEILITEAMAWPTSSDKWKALLRIHSIHVSWPI